MRYIVLVVAVAVAAASGCAARPARGGRTRYDPSIAQHPLVLRDFKQRHGSGGRSGVSMAVSRQGLSRYNILFTGTEVTSSTEADFLLTEGTAYVTGSFPGYAPAPDDATSGAESAVPSPGEAGPLMWWWPVVVTNRIVVTVPATTFIVQAGITPDDSLERVILLDNVGSHRVNVSLRGDPTVSVDLTRAGYVEYRRTAGVARLDGPFPLPTDPSDPVFQVIVETEAAAAAFGLYVP